MSRAGGSTGARRSRGSHFLPAVGVLVGTWMDWMLMLVLALGVLPGGAWWAPALLLLLSSPGNAQTQSVNLNFSTPAPATSNAIVGSDPELLLQVLAGDPETECPRCDAMFGMLARTELGTNVQNVHMQLRGEAKSGTSFMFEWAVNALVVTCSRLELLFGQETCRVSWRNKSGKLFPAVTKEATTREMKWVLLEFQPRNQPDASLGDAACKCKCEDVDKVSVTVSHLLKHSFPVPNKCPWQHVNAITREGKGCTTVAGRPVQNHTDTAECLQENPCEFEDSRLQMLILRDPRAVVVSSFFHLKEHHHVLSRSVDEFALRMLPTICRFVHLRWLLLRERMADKTVEFMYDESLADPLGWHQRWLSSVGLTPPKSVVQEATDTALRGEYRFTGKGVDMHPEGKEATPARSWEGEISAEVVEQLNGICRVWLSPVLLEKFGIDDAPP